MREDELLSELGELVLRNRVSEGRARRYRRSYIGVAVIAWLFGISTLGLVTCADFTRPPMVVAAITARATPRTPPKPVDPSSGYAWARYPGAEAYRVAFFSSNGHMKHSATVKSATVNIKLNAGRYHWVVWPVVEGEERRAIVSSFVVVK